jgi:WbqC-like protein family
MILTAHQPVYLPWLGLFHKIAFADTYCFFDSVQYETRGWNNRNYIKGGTNEKTLLTVPVLSKNHRDKLYTEIRLNNSISWQKKHWKAITLAYKKSNFFDLYADDLFLFYQKKWDYLVDLNFEMLVFFLKALGIKTKIVKMSGQEFLGRKSSLILDMCKKLNADTYLFGEQGENYADHQLFFENNIDIRFQQYRHPEYPQLQKPFESHLSVIDLLANCGNESLDVILHENSWAEAFKKRKG